MPTFLDTLFGGKKPTAAAARSELAKVEAELAGTPARIATADAALKRVADMSDEEHAAVEVELAAAKRSLVRLEARVIDLRNVRDEAERVEAAVALRARADATRKRATGMGKALDRYDAAAKALADVADEIGSIDGEVSAINREIEAARRAGLEAPESVQTSAELFRTEPDHVTPDRTVTEEVWEVPNDRGRWTPAAIYVERNGEMVPQDASARKRTVSHVVPGKTRPGRRIKSPIAGLFVPASRITGETHWPRAS